MGMLKILLFVLGAITIFSTSAFADTSIEINVSKESIQSLDPVLITGKITGVSEYKPVKLTITDPDRVIVYKPQVEINKDGTFKKLIQPTLPSFKTGTYTVIANNGCSSAPATTTVVVNPTPANPTAGRSRSPAHRWRGARRSPLRSRSGCRWY